MILTGDESPRWLRELARFLPIKNLLFIDGNIMDLLSFPVRSNGGDVFWTDDDLPNFLNRYLTGEGYEVVGFIDPVDGLTFPTDVMEAIYRELRKGKKPDVERIKKEKKEPEGENASEREDDDAIKHPTAVDFNNILQGVRASVRNPGVPCAFVFNFASRLITSPGNLIRDERSLLTKLLKASLESSDVFMQNGKSLKNMMFLLCDKLNDLPPFLYVNNPRARSIHIDKPDSVERARFLSRTYSAFYGSGPDKPGEGLTNRFAALTEGFTNYELMSLVHLSRNEEIELKNIENICQRYKYGVRESEWDKMDRARLAGAEELLHSRVKGQDAAISRVLDIIKRARIGLAAGQQTVGSRPRGVLFFAGPTGVGKTELAKSLAELLFGQEDRCIRFDMSEYSAPQSDEKLLGAPPGYVGYEEGGQLTNALKEKPFSILLFDEIEKAHGGVFDKFLQILDDGRITDGKGETVYFSESIIIFTSNLGTVDRSAGPEGRRMLVNPSMPYHEIRDNILEAIRDHFNFVLGRPEILNRFGDNFVVFDFIKPPVDEAILDLMISRLVKAAQWKWKIDLKVADPVREKLVGLARKRLHHGGRGVRNLVDTALVNPLTRFLFDYGTAQNPETPFLSGSKVHITELIDNGPDAGYQFEIEGEITD